MVTRYPLDTTGRSTTNRIRGESHPIDPDSPSLVFTKYGAFFHGTMEVLYQDEPLVLNQDWKYTLFYQEASHEVGLPISCAIQLLKEGLEGEIVLNYQCVGGEYQDLRQPVVDYLLNPSKPNVDKVYWDDIKEKPEVYFPERHLHDINDVFGITALVQVCEEMRRTLERASILKLKNVYDRFFKLKQYVESLMVGYEQDQSRVIELARKLDTIVETMITKDNFDQEFEERLQPVVEEINGKIEAVKTDLVNTRNDLITKINQVQSNLDQTNKNLDTLREQMLAGDEANRQYTDTSINGLRTELNETISTNVNKLRQEAIDRQQVYNSKFGEVHTRIDNLEADLANYENEVNNQLAELTRKDNELDNKIDEKNQESIDRDTALGNRIDQLDRDLHQEITNTNEKVDREVNRINDEIDETNDALEALRTDMETADNNIRAEVARLDAENDAKDAEIESKLNELTNDVNSYKETNDTEINALKEKDTDLDNRVTQLESDVPALRQDMTNADNAIKASITSLTEANQQAHEALQSDIDTLREDHDTFKTSQEAKNKEFEDKDKAQDTRLTDIEADLPKIRQEFKAADNALNTALTTSIENAKTNLNDKIVALGDALRTEMKTADDGIKSDLNALTGNVNNLSNVFNTFKSAQEQKNAELSAKDTALEGRINTLESNTNSAAEALEEKLNETKTALEGKIDSAKNELKDSISSLESKVDANTGSINTLKTDLNTAKSDLTSLIDTKVNTAKDELTTSISETRDSLFTLINEREVKLNTKIDGVADDLRNLEESSTAGINANKAEIDKLKQKDTSLEGRINDLTTALEDAKTSGNDDLEETKNDLQSKIDALNNKVATEVTRLDNSDKTINTSLTTLRNDMASGDDALRTLISNNTQTLRSELTTKADELDAKITKNTNDIAALKTANASEHATINNEIAKLKEKDNTFNTALESLRSDMESATSGNASDTTSKINALKEELTNVINTKEGGLNTRITALEGAKNDHDSRISALETSQGAQDAAITNINNSLTNYNQRIDSLEAKDRQRPDIPYTANGALGYSLGNGNKLTGNGALALGSNITASGGGNIVIGRGITASGGGNIVIGRGGAAPKASNIVIGVLARATATGGIAIGNSYGTRNDYGTVSGHDTIALGYNVNAGKTYNTVAIGANLRLAGYGNVILGGSSQGDRSPKTINGNNNIVLGADNTILGKDVGSEGLDGKRNDSPNTTYNTILGANNTINVDSHRNIIIGSNITVTGSDMVVIGNNSSSTHEASSHTRGKTTGRIVSIGDPTDPALLQNVDSGLIAAESTDGINGAQLFEVKTAIETRLSSIEGDVNDLNTNIVPQVEKNKNDIVALKTDLADIKENPAVDENKVNTLINDAWNRKIAEARDNSTHNDDPSDTEIDPSEFIIHPDTESSVNGDPDRGYTVKGIVYMDENRRSSEYVRHIFTPTMKLEWTKDATWVVPDIYDKLLAQVFVTTAVRPHPNQPGDASAYYTPSTKVGYVLLEAGKIVPITVGAISSFGQYVTNDGVDQDGVIIPSYPVVTNLYGSTNETDIRQSFGKGGKVIIYL